MTPKELETCRQLGASSVVGGPIKALLDAYDRLWIDVKERLPEMATGFHLVYVPRAFQKIHVAWWNPDLTYNGAQTNWENFHDWRSITHWMPLPSYPSAGPQE